MHDPVRLRIADKILAVEAEGGSEADKFARLLSRLDEEERAHPLGEWLIRARDRLYWYDNALDLAGALRDRPHHPDATERGGHRD